MMADEEADQDKKQPEGNLSDAEWQSLLYELNVDFEKAAKVAALRPITKEEIDYLLCRYAFLTLINADATEAEITKSTSNSPIEIKVAKSGWEIHVHKNHLIVSPGRWLFGPYRGESDDESGGGATLATMTGKGTIIKQIIDTADSMLEIASQRWPAATIKEGYSLMQFGAWIAAQRRGYTLHGFAPTAEHQTILKQLVTLKIIELPAVSHEAQERPR